MLRFLLVRALKNYLKCIKLTMNIVVLSETSIIDRLSASVASTADNIAYYPLIEILPININSPPSDPKLVKIIINCCKILSINVALEFFSKKLFIELLNDEHSGIELINSTLFILNHLKISSKVCVLSTGCVY